MKNVKNPAWPDFPSAGWEWRGMAEPRLSGLDNSKKAIKLCWQQGESSVTVLGQEWGLDAMGMLIL